MEAPSYRTFIYKTISGFSFGTRRSRSKPIREIDENFFIVSFSLSSFLATFFTTFIDCDARVLHSSKNVNLVAFNYRKCLFTVVRTTVA